VFVLGVVAGYFIARFRYKSMLDARAERLEQYKEQLDGASPEEARRRQEEARRRIEALEVQVQSLTPRLLTAEQRRIISSSPVPENGSIQIGTDPTCFDAAIYAADLMATFQSAGWRVSTTNINVTNKSDLGLCLITQDKLSGNRPKNVILEALSRADVVFEEKPMQNRTGFPDLIVSKRIR